MLTRDLFAVANLVVIDLFYYIFVHARTHTHTHTTQRQLPMIVPVGGH